MLDQATKRKIDNARDILVGKVPDPKSQVEQITIALIYKFMDDMDKESEEWGGEASFFTGGYEKYAWSKIFDARLGGFDLITLYSEALLKMNQNPNIPQLFRDIFKNAYLPYRDPETLKSFLKEINEFTYDHSERLGDAFEYLLSAMDSQGEAGQFRTPRHIIDFIVEIVDPKKNETVLDPACGTAGFLISSYKHILRANTKERTGDQLNPDEKKRLMSNFTGYDISPDMVRLSLVNLYLHSFSDPKIYEYDTLTSEERWDETADVILANPPFMTPKGGIRPHKRFSIQAKRSEVLFVDYIAEHLNSNGRAGVIVPEGIIFQSATAYINLRKMLVEDYLWAVVSLPAGVFQPYSGVKTSILLKDKNLVKKTNKILFLKIENDGFDLGAQRKPIDKNDLPKALSYIKDYQQAILTSREAEETNFAIIAEKSKIAENGDWNLSGERYREIYELGIPDYEMVELGDFCNIRKGTAITNKVTIKGDIPVIAGGKQPAYYHNESNRNGNVITVSASGANAGFVNYFKYPIFASDCSTVESLDENKVLTLFVFLMLKYKQEYIYSLQSGGGQPHIYPRDLENLKIPLPPLDVQKAIVAEIDSYQKIIDGARQVVDNYKPFIRIDPNWELVALGEVVKVDGKITHDLTNQDDEIYIGGDNIRSNTGQLIKFTTVKEKGIRGPAYRFKKNQILYSKLRPYLNKAIISAFDGYCSADMYPLTVDENFAKIEYVYLYILSPNFMQEIKDFYNRARMPKINKEQLYSVKIPLPPLSIQQEIVSQVEAEQEIVNANKKLIEIYKKKIKDKIAEVWGEKP